MFSEGLFTCAQFHGFLLQSEIFDAWMRYVLIQPIDFQFHGPDSMPAEINWKCTLGKASREEPQQSQFNFQCP